MLNKMELVKKLGEITIEEGGKHGRKEIAWGMEVPEDWAVKLDYTHRVIMVLDDALYVRVEKHNEIKDLLINDPDFVILIVPSRLISN